MTWHVQDSLFRTLRHNQLPPQILKDIQPMPPPIIIPTRPQNPQNLLDPFHIPNPEPDLQPPQRRRHNPHLHLGPAFTARNEQRERQSGVLAVARADREFIFVFVVVCASIEEY